MFNEDLFLTNEKAKYLYNNYAKDLPIIDYHCHLVPKEIYEDKVFEDIGEMWFAYDHYKWRAMRTFGIDESLITGNASYYDKFKAFSEIFPKLIGNPLYVWCNLELKRYFGIDYPLNEKNCDEIYNKTKELIKLNKISPRYLITKSNVKMIGTTDDPADSLEYHKLIKEDKNFDTKVLATFRPDKAMYIEKSTFGEYINNLSKVSSTNITKFDDLINVLENRLIFFKSLENNITDCGFTYFKWEDYTNDELDHILNKAMNNTTLSKLEIDKYRTAFIINLSKLFNKHNFVMQLHIGAYRNANTKMYNLIGEDKGFDCVEDKTQIEDIGKLLDTLNNTNELPKTILYPLNINNYETYAILAAAFCKSPNKAQVQLGMSWWFNDQSYGMTKQFESVANLYPISLSVGMLTDSRSFLSYPRHELFRRLLCNYLGEVVERNEYISSEEDLKEIINNICYYNAKEYFNIK